jgi:hypothetical protein
MQGRWTVWGAFVNLVGIPSTKPLKLKYSKDSADWWVNEGELKDDFNFEKRGLQVDNGCVRFMSENKKEVQAFINGVRALQTVLKTSDIPQFEIED